MEEGSPFSGKGWPEGNTQGKIFGHVVMAAPLRLHGYWQETPNTICSRGKICKDSNRGDKQSSLIHTSFREKGSFGMRSPIGEKGMGSIKPPRSR